MSSSENETPNHTHQSAARDAASPPPYSVATDLPTYEEAEHLKRQEAIDGSNSFNGHLPIEMCSVDVEHHREGNHDLVVGTDSMFVVGFLFSFLFNWLGLLLAFCVMHTCAGRFGALSGFGLSIVKWVVIVKSNDWAGGIAAADSWIWWLMMAFGMMICSSGFIHYLSVRNKWTRHRYTIFH